VLHASERFSGLGEARNPGIPLDLAWAESVRINRSAVERRAATLPARRTVKKEWQAGWLLRAITCLDLTALAGDDTASNVRRLCAKGMHPLQDELRVALGIDDLTVTVAAICVYHNLVPVAADALRGSHLPIAAVSTGFPAGQTPFPQKLEEIRASVRAGAGARTLEVAACAGVRDVSVRVAPGPGTVARSPHRFSLGVITEDGCAIGLLDAERLFPALKGHMR